MSRPVSAIRVALLVLAVTLGAYAQVSTADVVGTVTDASGAVVPGATVAILNTDTGATRTATASSSGDYSFSALQVGNYTLKVQAKGFSDYEARDVKLAVGDRLRLDVKLAVGQQTQSIEVAATAAALQTDSSDVGTMITDKSVQDLPLNGRNFINLVQLSAGVTEGLPNSMNSGTRPDDRRMSSSYSANGQTDENNNNLIDGLDNNERFIGTIGVRPSIDAIQEVRVTTNLPPAEIGRAAGAVVELITRSGTNAFHGSAYEFLRNDALDARNFFSITNPELRQNQFGGSVGGPIRKDKTFFFADYEGFRQVVGEPTVATVPTAFERANPGNFSDVGGPASTAGITALGTNLFSLYPMPTNGNPYNNYVANLTRTQFSHTLDGRVDHNLTANQRLFGRYSFNNVDTFTPAALPPTKVDGINVAPGSFYGGAGGQGFPGPAAERQQNLALGYTNVLSPNIVLELKAAYLRSNIGSSGPNGTKPVSNELGFNCDATSCLNVSGNGASGGLADILFVAPGPGGVVPTALGDMGYLPLSTIDNSFMYYGSLGWTRGAHTFKFGAGLTRRQLASSQSSWPRGFYLMTGGFPALLQGQAFSAQRSNSLIDGSYRSWEPSAYAQDDWHVNRWLTLNLGVRYDVYTPLTEVHGDLTNFDPSTGLLIGPDLPGAQKSGATAGVNTDYRDFAPRIGFSASIGHGMVVRGGFGMTYWPGSYASGALMKNAPYNYSFACGLAFAGSPCMTAPYGANGGFAVNMAAALPVPVLNMDLATNPANYIGTTINATAPDYRSSYLEQYLVQFQKEFRGNIVSVGYVGNLGRHLTDEAEINQPSNIANLYPYPNLPGTTIIQRESGGVSKYDALQLQFQRRFSHGLTANVNYTYSNSTGNTGVTDEGGTGTNFCNGWCPMDNPSDPSSPITVHGYQQYDYGNSDLDIVHNFSALVNYDLPFGKNLKGLSGAAVKGWSVNVIGSWTSGLPFTVLNATNVSGIALTNGVTSDRPDQIGSGTLSNPSILEWFNVNAFVPQTKGTLGNEKRNPLFGPPQRRIDASVFKALPLTERFTLQFRAECFNITNTPNFANPAATIGDAGVGTIAATSVGSTPRQLQFSLKFLF